MLSKVAIAILNAIYDLPTLNAHLVDSDGLLNHPSPAYDWQTLIFSLFELYQHGYINPFATKPPIFPYEFGPKE